MTGTYCLCNNLESLGEADHKMEADTSSKITKENTTKSKHMKTLVEENFFLQNF